MHIVGGTGHGKTQLLELLIHQDLRETANGDTKLSLCVIDSQGDMLHTLSHLKVFSQSAPASLADRLVLIDPTDTAYPVCLNMFDFNVRGMSNLRDLDRERILNATVELYEYLFGALLGAELTQRQGVIFRYLARLLMVIPGANVHTLRLLMEDGEPFREHIEKLEGSAKAFFDTQFFSRSFEPTKKQILARLWGVLSNPIFDRMFSHERNAIDLFEALQSGKIVLVNTAKELLQKEGSQILGRFFIAMIAQAVLKRAVVPKDERVPSFIYIDEAHEYFDEKIEDLLNQARKYRVGITLAHQNLDQLSRKLEAMIMASTSVKLVGGVSAKDAGEFAREMHCTGEYIQDTRKTKHASTVACYVRNVTSHPLKVSIPLGAVESEPAMSESDYESLLAENRARYCAPAVFPKEREKRASRPQQKTATVLEESLEDAVPLPVAIPEIMVRAESIPSKAQTVETPLPTTVPRPKPPPVVAPLGRGGREHKYLQGVIKQLAESRGFRATIEEEILEGGGSIDIALHKGDTRIACEISVTSTPEQELGNVRKCLEAGYTQVVLLSSEKKQIAKLKKSLSERLTRDELGKVLFFLPEEFTFQLHKFWG